MKHAQGPLMYGGRQQDQLPHQLGLASQSDAGCVGTYQTPVQYGENYRKLNVGGACNSKAVPFQSYAWRGVHCISHRTRGSHRVSEQSWPHVHAFICRAMASVAPASSTTSASECCWVKHGCFAQ